MALLPSHHMADPEVVSPETQPNWKSAKNYYYWHGHEKERALQGDVAPMPVPVLIKKEELQPEPLARPKAQIVKKYSWADGKQSVSVYVETVEADGDTLMQETVQVNFGKYSVALEFEVISAGGTSKRRSLRLFLAKKAVPEKCSFKFKPSSKQLYLKVAKDVEETWFELTGAERAEDEENEEEVSEKEDVEE